MACDVAAGAACAGAKKDSGKLCGRSSRGFCRFHEPVTESDPDDMNYKLTYDKDKVPDELANTIALLLLCSGHPEL